MWNCLIFILEYSLEDEEYFDEFEGEEMDEFEDEYNLEEMELEGECEEIGEEGELEEEEVEEENEIEIEYAFPIENEENREISAAEKVCFSHISLSPIVAGI